MAKNLKWYMDAQKSENPEIKDLLNKIETTKDEAQVADFVKQIKEMLLAEKAVISKTENTDFVVESKTDITKGHPPFIYTEPYNDTKHEIAKNAKSQKPDVFPYTEDSIKAMTDDAELNEVIRACEAEIKKIEENRKRKENAHQKADILTQQWKYTRMIWIARGVIREKKRKIKKAQQTQVVGKLAQKRAIFCAKTRRGISITNIIGEDEITKENIEEIVNKDVIDTCCEFDPAFAQRWIRWKAKFL